MYFFLLVESQRQKEGAKHKEFCFEHRRSPEHCCGRCVKFLAGDNTIFTVFQAGKEDREGCESLIDSLLCVTGAVLFGHLGDRLGAGVTQFHRWGNRGSERRLLGAAAPRPPVALEADTEVPAAAGRLSRPGPNRASNAGSGPTCVLQP